MKMNHPENSYVIRSPRGGRKWMMITDLALIFVAITIIYGPTVSADTIFSEGGGPYALEEEILEELAKGRDLNTEEKEFAGSSSAVKPPPPPPPVPPKVDNAVFNIPAPPFTSKEQPSAPKEPQSSVNEQAPQSSDEQQQQPRPQPTLAPSPPVESVPNHGPPAVGVNAKQQYDELKSAAAAIMKQTSMLQHQQKPSKQKKEGQEEFATFVDPFSQPAQNRRLNADRPSFSGHIAHEEKRIPMNAGGSRVSDDLGDTVFIAVTTVCSAAAIFGLIGAGVCWYRMHKQYKAAQDVEYPHYGVTGPSKERTSGSTSPVAAMDAKLASSAQLYHYQHTKQQIIAMENSTSDAKGQDSEDSEGEGDEGDYSVYECPGLAPTGDIEVSNPLFENVASPHTRQPPADDDNERAQSPRVHQRSPVREDQ